MPVRSEYDVFLSYGEADKAAVENIAYYLRQNGLEKVAAMSQGQRQFTLSGSHRGAKENESKCDGHPFFLFSW